MLHHGFWLFEYISISQTILKGQSKYGRAYLHTERDGNDLTYFVLYHLDIIRRAVKELHAYIRRKASELKNLEALLRGLDDLNHRQRALLSSALRHPGDRYTVESHRLTHNVVPETARGDLIDLLDRGLLVGKKSRKRWIFTAPTDLAERLRSA